jgi:Arc/MetJ-type ribon-helix-helix transcriptional regulator
MEPEAMNFNLTPAQEMIVKDELDSGHFHSVEEVIAEALRALLEKEKIAGSAGPNAGQREAVSEMITFVEKSRVRLEGITVNELIHEGHRL